MREGELIAGVVLGYNFGDGHFHDQRLLAAVQERCHFEPGELRVVTLESQPARVPRQRYRIFDAAEGLLEEGTVEVADMVKRQPWLDEEPFPARPSPVGTPHRRTGPPRRMSEAVVVGAGPNGLACAATLAKRGVGVTVIEAAAQIGGGARTSELTLPGLLHDDCSAVHSMAVGSPALNELALDRHGLQWAWPRSRLGPPARGWWWRGDAALDRAHGRRAGGRRATPGGASSVPPPPPLRQLSEDIMRPLLHPPRHPLALARFGLAARDRRPPCSPAPWPRPRRALSSAASPRTPSARSASRSAPRSGWR